MLLFMLSLTLPLITTSKAAQGGSQWFESNQSAASESQIKFAIENKYDGTGPGAKAPEYAYSTYKTLEDALIAYLDDPDTKLPEHEREKAIQKLLKNQPTDQGQDLQRFYPKTVEEYIGYQRPEKQSSFPEVKVPLYFQESPGLSGYKGNEVSLFKVEKKPTETYKLQRVQSVKGIPLSLAHYTKDYDYDSAREQFNHHPKYTFSYGVHDKDTGDSKTAHETREGGTVHGYYSFMDADGKQRVVHYTADDKLGFRATVQRTGLDSH